MRVVFFGSGEFGLPTLQRLHANHDVSLVVSQPDRPAGRGSKMTPTPIAQWAQEHDLEIIKPENVNEREVTERIRSIECDGWVVIAFGQKLSPSLLADRRAMNLHASLLPRWRGAAPIHHAILSGDSITGNSVITLADKMDAGLVLATSNRLILPEYTTAKLHELLAQDGPDLIESCLIRSQSEWPFGAAQDPSKVTHARKLSKSDACIDFNVDAATCRNRIHAFNPWPGVEILFRDQPLKLHRASAGHEAGTFTPGELIDASIGTVYCGQGTSLQLLEVQSPGKRSMTWSEFAAGHQPQRGEIMRGGPRS
ncbi:MAG: methionyl-tRNA formyltransferase [Phycisphaerales bacterium]